MNTMNKNENDWTIAELLAGHREASEHAGYCTGEDNIEEERQVARGYAGAILGRLDKVALDVQADVNCLKRLLGHHTMSGVRSALQRIWDNAERLKG